MDLLSSENQGISTLGNVGALQSLNKYKSSCQPYNVLADKIIDKILSQPTQVRYVFISMTAEIYYGKIVDYSIFNILN